eukprot:g17568.t1
MLNQGSTTPPAEGTGLQNAGGQLGGTAGAGLGAGGGIFATGGAPAGSYGGKDGTVVEEGGKSFYVPPQLTDAEKQKRVEASNKFKLKKEPNTTWCKFGEFCNNVLTTGECNLGKHLKREYWRMISQFEKNCPAKYKAFDEKRKAAKKAKEEADKAAKAAAKK